MILVQKNNNAELIALAPSIKNHMPEWQIVNFRVSKTSDLSIQEIIQKLISQYKSYDGILFKASSTRIIMIIRFGILEDYTELKTEIESKMPGHCCRIMVRKMSAAGMKQIQIDLTQRDNSIELIDNLYRQRKERKKNVILIADDDAFIRKSMSALLSSCGDIEEQSAGDKVVQSYLKCNPDILLLDIHMPQKSGLEVVDDIMNIDADAFIVILSADSSTDNVIEALDKGAAGFLTKPPAKEKLQEYLNQCMTIH